MGTEKIMRLEDVFLNGNISLGEKSKIALRRANSEGIVPDDAGNCNGRLKISGLLYESRDRKATALLTYPQYLDLGKPEYITETEQGIRQVPQVLIPRDFKPKEFDD